MSVKPRTIDALGIESSRRYAKDKELYEAKYLEESRFIPQKTESSALKPYLPQELEEYLFSNQKILWASFEPPPEALAYAKSFFTHQIIPSLGSYEKQEANVEKLEALENDLKQKKKRKKKKEDEEGERERKALLTFAKTLYQLDRTLSLINSRRCQYQRG